MTAPALCFGKLPRRHRPKAPEPKKDLCCCPSCLASRPEREEAHREQIRELQRAFRVKETVTDDPA
jgi:hypothetical protein